MNVVLRAPRYAGIGLVWAYRLTLGALFPATCKYEPSCSEYAIQALRTHGLFKGSALAGWRLLRCNPWSHGGHDPVPGSSRR
jgi:putative membrane protein insertion efficiency factor